MGRRKFEEKLWMKQPKNIRRHYKEGITFLEFVSIALLVVGLIMFGLSLELKSINNNYSLAFVLIGGALLYFNYRKNRARVLRIRGHKRRTTK